MYPYLTAGGTKITTFGRLVFGEDLGFYLYNKYIIYISIEVLHSLYTIDTFFVGVYYHILRSYNSSSRYSKHLPF